MLFRSIITSAMIAVAITAAAYEPVKGHIMTEWGEKIDPTNVWQEYPRPIMQRTAWENLNGEWDYAITPKRAQQPEQYEGQILVPFCAESALSGVGRRVGKENALWYRRTFTVPKDWKGKDVMLNFGAVDWECTVWVNGIKVGKHNGGFTPFGLNITDALAKKGANELVVKVWDPGSKGTQPRGKQHDEPHGIWYTPVTGIWQTVWLEPVAKTHIASLRTLPNIDYNTLTVTAVPSDGAASYLTEVTVTDNGRKVASGKSINGQPVTVEMPADVKLWSPDSPALYDLEVTLYANGKPVDKVKSYAAMRKFGMMTDSAGIKRLTLNDKPLFQFGPLDQGWWPDGLYTAPSYEALIYDVDKTKELGFNMIRKHIKVEPAVWYTYCDRAGIIVWQDMPFGDLSDYTWQQHKWYEGNEQRRGPESEAIYRREWKDVMDYLYSYPCIGMWIPFNEGWGQFKTVEITDWTKKYDPSRLVNSASGGNFFRCGDVMDLHNYPGPAMFLYDENRANVLGEYGGIGLAVDGHLWVPDRNWGYVQFKTPDEVTDKYVQYAGELLDFTKKGFTGAVYTQTTDVEIEVNGLMTYDRKVVKVDPERVRKANQALVNSLNK